MAKATFKERLRYWFDNTMAKGTPALIGWLAVASLVLVLIVTVLATPWAGKDSSALDVAWRSLLRTLDPGTMGGDEGNPVFLGLMLTVTLGGLLIVSALIGVLTTGLDNKLSELRKGRSRVVESGHTIVLGWSDAVFTVINELVTARASEKSSRIAVLADMDKVEMEDEIRARLGKTGKTRVVCRTGSPTEPSDLDIVSPDTARSIIVLSPQGDDPDAHVIKTLLSIANRPWRRRRPPVVAAVRSSRNLPAAQLAGGGMAYVVDADDIASRLVVQSCRQAGLSVVCTDLLDFDGDEMYMRREPALAGLTYGQALLAYETATLIGLRNAGGVVVNPPMDTLIYPDDELIVIAGDDSLIQLARELPFRVDSAIVAAIPRPPTAERMLMLGWNGRSAKIIRQLDAYVAPRSVLDIAARKVDRNANLMGLRNLSVNAKEIDTTDRFALESLDVGTYQHIIVLSDENYDPQHADSRTLVTLLHLRDMEQRLGESYSIVSEMNDEGNRRLAQVTKADDFVVSDKLISLLLTQLSENPHLSHVFTHLFDPAGSEIYLKPAENYVRPGQPVNFATVIESAARRGESAIGFRLHAQFEQPPAYGVVLNPGKAEHLTLTYGDRVIVLAED